MKSPYKLIRILIDVSIFYLNQIYLLWNSSLRRKSIEDPTRHVV